MSPTHIVLVDRGPLSMKSDRGLQTFADARHSGAFTPITSDFVIFPVIRLRESQKNIRTRLKILTTPLDLDSVLTVTRHRGYFLKAKYPVPSGQGECAGTHDFGAYNSTKPITSEPVTSICCE